MVADGLGTPMGLTPAEHAALTRDMQHPLADAPLVVDWRVEEALKHEVENTVEDLDAECEDKISTIVEKALELQAERSRAYEQDHNINRSWPNIYILHWLPGCVRSWRGSVIRSRMNNSRRRWHGASRLWECCRKWKNLDQL